MQAFRVSCAGPSVPIPERFYEENRFAFFHGGAARVGEQFSPGTYILRLSKDSFPVGKKHNWFKAEYSLVLAHGCENDEVGNPIYIARRSFVLSRDGNCFCFLDIGNAAIFHSWNKQVILLGRGVENRAIQLKRDGARRPNEIEHLVLVCYPGARFEWTTNGLNHGIKHNDYRAEWDGFDFHVVQQPLAVTELMERLCLSEQAEHRETLRWSV